MGVEKRCRDGILSKRVVLHYDKRLTLQSPLTIALNEHIVGTEVALLTGYAQAPTTGSCGRRRMDIARETRGLSVAVR
jgi:hypothetical protein